MVKAMKTAAANKPVENVFVKRQRFSACLKGWDLMERTLRQVYGYEGCIFGPDESCPAQGPTHCDACVGRDR